ncbi:MAG: type II CRISPR RNA-guided endonuclease Cas9 [Clostridia bacterium]
MEKKKYFLGLDIGTESVGFAATDLEYNVLKKGKKSMIGSRLFESGNSAEERRGYRCSRRRTERNRQRIEFLRMLFSDEIAKIDPAFFQRLDESMYHHDDKSIDQYNSIFNDADYTDKEYHEQYPTVFHLRKALMNEKITDPRFLYLGLEHIIKNRGHFLFMGNDFGEISDFNNVYLKFNELLEIEEYSKFNLKIEDISALEAILKDKSINITKGEKKIYALLDSKPSNEQKSIIKLLLGGSVELQKLFSDLDEDLAKKKVSFKGDFETLYAEIETKLDDKIILIDMAKAIYDWSILVEILDCPHENNDRVTLSDAQIFSYETHKNDLKVLKELIKQYIPEKYKDVFVNPNLKVNYPAYIGMSNINGKKVPIKEKICSQEDFCKYILSLLKNLDIVEERYVELIANLDLHSALPKQRTSSNSVIPYQVHKQELDLILEKASESFGFLRTTDDSLSISEKIKMIFMYRIPYYVGPLNVSSSFAWIEKNSNEKIYPWNFDDVVNKELSAEKFIERMTNKCRYLSDEYVLPKESLLYSKFTLLNELNKLKLDGEPISVEIKKELFENVFMKNKKVTRNRVKTHLIKQSLATSKVEIGGIDGDFKGSLGTYIDFIGIFDENFDENMVEDIVRWIVLFGQDKTMLKTKISANYKLTKAQLDKVSRLKYSGWGNLSKKFLTEIYSVDKATGEAVNIIDAMMNTNCNLMQLLSKDFDYMSKVQSQEKIKTDITLADIKELYCSPAVKKSIWQAVKIVKEIEKIMGGKPEKLFVEMTRSEGEKKATTSRKRDLDKKYGFYKKEYTELIDQLSGYNDSDLRQKKLYLYFTQLGRCAYTGREIDLGSLNSSFYDIEHIYPRSKTKDDSIHNNLVLVERTANEEKTDKYPIPEKYRQVELWKTLYKMKLIEKTKFERLMRTTEFEPRELEGFIARQLVETSQASKAVATLFTNYFKADENCDSKVVYVKAGNVSDFRHHFKIVKSRDINDYHHAHDAYLNIVVGNIWNVKFTDNFFKSISNEKFNLKPEQLYRFDVKKGDYYAWKVGDKATIQTVKDTVYDCKILFTRQSFKASGGLFDASHSKKITKQGSYKLPIKSSNPILADLEKYGSYKSIKPSYFVLVEYQKGKKLIRELVSIPIFVSITMKDKPEIFNECISRIISTSNFKVYKTAIKTNSLAKIDGAYVHLSGGADIKNAMQLILSVDDIKYIKELTKCVERGYITKHSIVTSEKNLELYDLFTDKLLNSIYSKIKRHVVLGELLTSKREYFKSLELEQQLIALVQILSIFKCKAGNADLRIIKGKERTNRLNISLNITKNYKEFKIITQSITGLYEGVIDLLDENLFEEN